MLGAFFKSRHTSSTIFAQISPKLAKFPIICPRRIKEHDLQKKRLHFHFGCHLYKNQSTYSDFADFLTNVAQISTDIARILHDFARIFTKSKLFGVPLLPSTPAFYASACHRSLRPTHTKFVAVHFSRLRKHNGKNSTSKRATGKQQ